MILFQTTIRTILSYFPILNFLLFQPQIVLKLFLFPDISKQWVTVVAQKKKMALRNVCSLLFHSAKKMKLSMQRPRTS